MKTNESPKKENIRLRGVGAEDGGSGHPEGNVGELLRRAREEQGLDLADISKALKIRISLLEDMEKGNMENMPVQAFSIGFFKLYVRHLGLDDEAALVARFVSQIKPQKDSLTHFAPPPLSSPNRPGVGLIIMGVVLFALGFVGYERYISKTTDFSVAGLREQLGLDGKGWGTTDETTPLTVPEGPTLDGKQVVENVLVPAPGAAPPSEAVAPSPVKAEQKAEPVVPLPALDAKPSVEIAAPSPPEAATDQTPQVVSEPPPEEEEAQQPTSGSLDTLTLMADEKVWVQIKNKERQTVKEMVLKEGETFSIDREEYRFLTVGNAGGVRLRAASQESQPLGAKGKVLRNLDLSASSVRKIMAKQP